MEPPPPDLAGAAVAVTLRDCDADPPGPVQVSVSDSVALTATARLPLVGWLPVQELLPLAVQVVAFWLLHVSVVVSPALTEVGLAEKVTVGAAEAMFKE
jgi:hypothetical protein